MDNYNTTEAIEKDETTEETAGYGYDSVYSSMPVPASIEATNAPTNEPAKMATSTKAIIGGGILIAAYMLGKKAKNKYDTHIINKYKQSTEETTKPIENPNEEVIDIVDGTEEEK